MENKEVVKERVRRYRERQKGGQPPRMEDVVPEWARGVNGAGQTATEIAMKDVPSISPVVLEMIGGLEKRVAALEVEIKELRDRLDFGDLGLVSPPKKDNCIGKHTFKKDSPEDLFKRVVAEKAERLSIV